MVLSISCVIPVQNSMISQASYSLQHQPLHCAADEKEEAAHVQEVAVIQ